MKKINYAMLVSKVKEAAWGVRHKKTARMMAGIGEETAVLFLTAEIGMKLLHQLVEGMEAARAMGITDVAEGFALLIESVLTLPDEVAGQWPEGWQPW